MRKLVRSALTALGYLAITLIVMFIAIYVETNTRDLELPLARAGGLVAIIGAVVWWRVPKRLRWLPEWLFIIGSAAFLIFATLDGWGGVVAAGYILSLLAIIVTATVLQERALRVLFSVPPELAVEASQPISPYEFDDADAVKIYPDRRRLIQVLLVGILALAACGGPGLYAYTQPAMEDAQAVVVVSAVASAFCLLAILVSILQFIRPQPLFTLSDAGIHIRKMTLVRWREIVGMYIVGEGNAKSWVSRRTLILRVANSKAVVSRQARRSQWALRLGNSMFGSPVAISEQQLPMPLEQLEEMLVPYLKSAHGDERGDDERLDDGDEQAQD